MTNEMSYPPGDEPPDTRPLTGKEAEAALGRLGTSSALLGHATFRGYLIRRDFSHRHYPVTTPGFMDWAAANKVLRDVHVPLGWVAWDDNGVPKTTHPTGSFSITIVGGNEDTGLEHRIPSTRRPRGGQGRADVADNQQTDLFGYTPPRPRGKTYYLLVHAVDEGRPTVLRAELSLPWELNHSGDVVRWQRRIILPQIDLENGPPELRNDDDAPPPDIDVRVERRGA